MRRDRPGHSSRRRRIALGAAWTVALLALGSRASAEETDAPLAFVSGASVFVAGFAAGGALLGANAANSFQANAGWLTIEAGFILAPIVSHAVTGRSVRGLWFAAPPAAAWGVTMALFEADPLTIEQGAIGEQRILWSLFGVALLSGVAGVVDAVASAEQRRVVAIAPLVGPGRVGVSVGAQL